MKIKGERLSDGEIEQAKVLAVICPEEGLDRVKVERAEDPPHSLWLTAQIGETTLITYWAEVSTATEVVAKASANKVQTTWKIQCRVEGLLGRAQVEFCLDKGANLPVGGVVLKFNASSTEYE